MNHGRRGSRIGQAFEIGGTRPTRDFYLLVSTHAHMCAARVRMGAKQGQGRVFPKPTLTGHQESTRGPAVASRTFPGRRSGNGGEVPCQLTLGSRFHQRQAAGGAGGDGR